MEKRNITPSFSCPFSISFPNQAESQKNSRQGAHKPLSTDAMTQLSNTFQCSFTVMHFCVCSLPTHLPPQLQRLMVQTVSHICCSRALPTQQSFVIITLLLSSSSSLCSANTSLIKARQVCLMTSHYHLVSGAACNNTWFPLFLLCYSNNLFVALYSIAFGMSETSKQVLIKWNKP